MNEVQIILTVFSTVVTLLIGSGGILFYKQNKKIKEVKIVHDQSVEWKLLYDDQTKKLDKAEERIEELLDERKSTLKETRALEKDYLSQLRDKDVIIHRQNIEIIDLRYNKCIVPHCGKRDPKRNENNGLLEGIYPTTTPIK